MPESPPRHAPADEAVRSRLAVALDVADLDRAIDLAAAVAPWFGVAKVGLQLFSVAGPAAVAAIGDQGLDVFLDLKLHDIPNTVGAAATEIGALGVRYLTVHASGGEAMLAAAVDGLATGAARLGLAPPVALAVTVLTSDSEAPPEVLTRRLDAAVAAGCTGVVCAAPDLEVIKSRAPDIVAVTPGIRLAGGSVHDQVRIATPASAVAAGADLLVVGRAVTGAEDPVAASSTVASEVAAALGR